MCVERPGKEHHEDDTARRACHNAERARSGISAPLWSRRNGACLEGARSSTRKAPFPGPFPMGDTGLEYSGPSSPPRHYAVYAASELLSVRRRARSCCDFALGKRLRSATERRRPRDLQGLRGSRLKRLELSTFGMATTPITWLIADLQAV